MTSYHVFSGNPLNRGETERRDEHWIVDASSGDFANFVIMKGAEVFVLSGGEYKLVLLNNNDLKELGIEYSSALFLGTLDSKAYFVLDISNDSVLATEFDDKNKRQFLDVRAAGGILSGEQSGILAQAKSQIDWHRKNRYCSVCGQETLIARGGQVRRCDGCDSMNYPRVDPVIITVVSDGGRCLLGQSRGRATSSNRFSALAGFVDQGESIEEAVIREVMEESGIEIKNIRYHSSQPWPFPYSLMIGCHADAVTTDITIDEEEMADVRWFSRDEVIEALGGVTDKLTLPGPLAIAHHLIKSWAENQRR